MRPPGPTVGAWVPPGAGQPVSARPGPPPGRPTNTLAIAALVASFVCGPAGLIMGILARQQIRQRNEAGDGLALAAIIVGSVNLALSLLIGCVVASADTGTTY